MQIIIQAYTPPAGCSVITADCEPHNAIAAASPLRLGWCSFVLFLSTFISLSPRQFQTNCLISCGPRGRHLDLDRRQTDLVSLHPSYYLLCFTRSQIQCFCFVVVLFQFLPPKLHRALRERRVLGGLRKGTTCTQNWYVWDGENLGALRKRQGSKVVVLRRWRVWVGD